MNMETTFLTEKQIWGDDQGKGQLHVMKSYGTKTGMSDLAIMLGGYMGSSSKTSDDQRAGYVWSASSYGVGYVRTVYYDGDRGDFAPNVRYVGARPALPSSVTSSIRPSEVRPSRTIGGVEVVQYGEYPQTIASEDVSRELEQVFLRRKLDATDKKYTFDGERYDAYDKPFTPKEYVEYQHKGKRYIRVDAQPNSSNFVLSNGHVAQSGECWIEVQPIEWLKDPSGIWVARQALFSGVQFDKNQRYDGNFSNTDMKRYLDNYFSKEMLAANRNVGTPSVVGPTTAALADRKARQRQQALADPSQGI